jgi:hypothetical protein
MTSGGMNGRRPQAGTRSAEPKRGAASGRGRAASAERTAPDIGNLAMQRLFREGTIHAKLAIGAVDDPLERQADRMADHALRAPAPVLRRQCACGGGGCAECRNKPTVAEASAVRRESATGAGPSVAPPAVHQVLGRAGRPLDSATRADMEGRFGRDFGDVRIHTDRQAAASADAVDALAYTVGSDIAFADRQYAPQSDAGRRLLAHELAHVTMADPLIRRQPSDAGAPTPPPAPDTTPDTQQPPPADAGAPAPPAAESTALEDRATRPASKAIIRAMNRTDPEASGGVGDFAEAFRIVNGLAMFDILATLAELNSLGSLQLLRDHIGEAVGVDRDRIELGIVAVADRTTVIQKGWPAALGDAWSALPPEQQQDITNFLGVTPGVQARVAGPEIPVGEILAGILVGALIVGAVVVLVTQPELAPIVATLARGSLLALRLSLPLAGATELATGGAVVAEVTTTVEVAGATTEVVEAGNLARTGYQATSLILRAAPTVAEGVQAAPTAAAVVTSTAPSVAQAVAILSTAGAVTTLSSDQPSTEPKEDENACPEPLEWTPTNVSSVIASGGIPGGLGLCEPFTPAYGNFWSGHHVWPKYAGGPEDQPLMGIYEYVHNIYVHPVLNGILTRMFDITQNTTDPKNIQFIADLRTDPALRSRFALALTSFYAHLNSLSSPPIPPEAYLLGINESYARLS